MKSNKTQVSWKRRYQEAIRIGIVEDDQVSSSKDALKRFVDYLNALSDKYSVDRTVLFAVVTAFISGIASLCFLMATTYIKAADNKVSDLSVLRLSENAQDILVLMIDSEAWGVAFVCVCVLVGFLAVTWLKHEVSLFALRKGLAGRPECAHCTVSLALHAFVVVSSLTSLVLFFLTGSIDLAVCAVCGFIHHAFTCRSMRSWTAGSIILWFLFCAPYILIVARMFCGVPAGNAEQEYFALMGSLATPVLIVCSYNILWMLALGVIESLVWALHKGAGLCDTVISVKNKLSEMCRKKKGIHSDIGRSQGKDPYRMSLSTAASGVVFCAILIVTLASMLVVCCLRIFAVYLAVLFDLVHQSGVL